MNTAEFKNEFLLEYDTHASNRAPGMNDYMISYWLTAAQNQLVKDYLTPKSNRRAEGFEMTEARRRKLAHLVRPLVLTTPEPYDSNINININSLIYDVSGYRIQEIKEEHLVADPTVCNALGQVEVVPITHDEYTQLIKNPFRTPYENLAWRMDLGDIDNADNAVKKIEIITMQGFIFTSYNLRYVMRPRPIIISDMTLTIEGENAQRTCKLDEQFHREIVYRAVTNALESISNPRFQTHIALDQQMQIE